MSDSRGGRGAARRGGRRRDSARAARIARAIALSAGPASRRGAREDVRRPGNVARRHGGAARRTRNVARAKTNTGAIPAIGRAVGAEVIGRRVGEGEIRRRRTGKPPRPAIATAGATRTAHRRLMQPEVPAGGRAADRVGQRAARTGAAIGAVCAIATRTADLLPTVALAEVPEAEAVVPLA